MFRLLRPQFRTPDPAFPPFLPRVLRNGPGKLPPFAHDAVARHRRDEPHRRTRRHGQWLAARPWCRSGDVVVKGCGGSCAVLLGAEWLLKE